MENQKSTAYLDFLRVFSIISVIILHVVSGVQGVIPEQMTDMQYNVYTVIKNTFAFGVPVFLMISGTLFLNPQKKVPLKTLFTKYIRRLVLALVLFGTVFALMETVVNASFKFKPVQIWQAFTAMLSGKSWAHLWYLYALIGIYLIMPVLKAFAEKASKNTYLYVLILLFVMLSVIPFFETLFDFKFGVTLPISVIYVLFYLTGYYIHTYVDCSRIPTWPLIAVCVLCVAFNIANLFLDWDLKINYESPVVGILSTAIFMLACKKQVSVEIFKKLRPYVFPVYLIHTVFINFSYKIFDITPLACGGYVLIPVFVIADAALSLAAAFVMMKIPVLKKYVI